MSGETKAVGKAHPDDRQVRIALDEPVHALRLPGNRRPASENSRSVTAAQPEHHLVARPSPRTRDREHRTQAQVAAMCGKPRQRHDGFALGKGSERQHPVAMLRDRLGKNHFSVRNAKMLLISAGRRSCLTARPARQLSGGRERDVQTRRCRAGDTCHDRRRKPKTSAVRPTGSGRLLARTGARRQQIQAGGGLAIRGVTLKSTQPGHRGGAKRTRTSASCQNAVGCCDAT